MAGRQTVFTFWTGLEKFFCGFFSDGFNDPGLV